MRASSAELPAPARSILLVLCTKLGRSSEAIEPRFSPSLAGLAHMTGYHVSTVCRWLGFLEAEGWVIRHRRDRAEAGRFHLPTVYALSIPPSRSVRGVPVADREAPSRPARQAPLAERQPAPSRSETQSDRDTPQTVLISDDDLAELAELVRGELATLTGRVIGQAEAAEAARLVLAGREPRNPAAYLRRSIRADPQRFLPARSGPPPFHELARLQAEAMAKDTEKGL